MKKNWQVIGITIAVAGALVYPAIKLYQYLAKKKGTDESSADGTVHTLKAFFPAFRGTRKHHHTEHNGHAHPGAV